MLEQRLHYVVGCTSIREQVSSEGWPWHVTLQRELNQSAAATYMLLLLDASRFEWSQKDMLSRKEGCLEEARASEGCMSPILETCECLFTTAWPGMLKIFMRTLDQMMMECLIFLPI